MLEDKKIKVQWMPEYSVETIGHQMPDGWWYIYLPFDKDWHFVRNEDVSVINETM